MHQNQVGEPLQQGVNWGEMVRKGGELTYKCSGINSSKACSSNIHKRTINYSKSLADTLSYLLKMEGTHNKELLHISKSIWSYLLSKQIAVSAEYLPSALNVHADWESQNAKDNSDWKLDVSVFQEQHTWDNQLRICLHPDSATIFLNTLHENHTWAV